MPKSDRQKLALLYILDFLERESDENHAVSAEQLISMLDRNRISCSKKLS